MSGGIAMDVQAADDDDVMTVWSSPVANTSEILTQDTITKLDKRNVADALSVVPGVSLQNRADVTNYRFAFVGSITDRFPFL